MRYSLTIAYDGTRYAGWQVQSNAQSIQSLIQAALKIVELYRDTLRPDAANVSKAATVAYQSEQSSLLNVLETQNLSIDVEFALFDALANYEQSIADLERAIGVSVPGERKPL